ncbi:hypothetical protein [Chitinophaga cymbidii]|uniref:Uncharacterized protein n=1 Tax=Chitinophaga cymbidii TaxID=1096750 RepID=A0A512RKM5_9BACT|nr:hypothetical protein [Chitinophaga cymbidii]GEP96222.1 hypothetical protein CCY01nite_24820 [Chitinophaga cymbidii]
MTFAAFKETLKNDQPPAGLRPVLEAMWWDGKGDWDRSHDIAQEVHSAEGSWVHAYLHRKEGDRGNAAYWYARAGKSMPGGSLEAEWEQVVTVLLRENAG